MRSKWRALTLTSWRVFVNVAISDVNLLDSRIDPEHTRAGIEEKEKEQSYNDIGEKMDNGIDEKSDAGVDAKMADAELGHSTALESVRHRQRHTHSLTHSLTHSRTHSLTFNIPPPYKTDNHTHRETHIETHTHKFAHSPSPHRHHHLPSFTTAPSL